MAAAHTGSGRVGTTSTCVVATASRVFSCPASGVEPRLSQVQPSSTPHLQHCQHKTAVAHCRCHTFSEYLQTLSECTHVSATIGGLESCLLSWRVETSTPYRLHLSRDTRPIAQAGEFFEELSRHVLESGLDGGAGEKKSIWTFIKRLHEIKGSSKRDTDVYKGQQKDTKQGQQVRLAWKQHTVPTALLAL